MAVGAPLSEIYASGNIGSSRGAAGFEAGVAAGTHAYSCTMNNPRKAVAAAFVVGVNDFSDWIAGFDLGGLDAFDDDADGDGIDNGVENFFGTPPDAFSIGLVGTGVSGGSFTFTHSQNPTPAGDLIEPTAGRRIWSPPSPVEPPIAMAPRWISPSNETPPRPASPR